MENVFWSQIYKMSFGENDLISLSLSFQKCYLSDQMLLVA